MRSILALVLSVHAIALAQRTDTVVRAATRPLHAGVATLQQEISIGIPDGDEHYMLGAIGDIAVGTNGSIYVFDRSIPAIRMYDAGGKYLKTIGAKGRGPGEYLAGAALAVAKNGNLLMWDPGNARINVYSATGDIVAHWPTLSGGSGTASGRNLLTVDTAGIARIMTHAFTRVAGQRPTSKTVWIRFLPDGALRDTVSESPTSRADAGLTATSADGRSSAAANVPFAPVHYSVLSPLGYFVTGVSDRLSVELHETGRPLVSIRRDIGVQPVSGHERDSARSEVTTRMRGLDPTWSWNGADIPKTKPAYRGLRVGADGRIWVALSEGPRDPNHPATPMSIGGGSSRGGPPRGSGGYSSCESSGAMLYDVYEPSGTYVGQVQIPKRVGLLIMRGDYIWGTACNDDDVPSVVRYRINWR